MTRRTVPGTLSLAGMAVLHRPPDPAAEHRPDDPEALAAEAHRLAATGLKPQDIAELLRLTAGAVTALLAERISQ